MSNRESMEYDVVVIGGGPAGLTCAMHLKQLRPELNVCLLEKGAEIGTHILSGAVMEPQVLDELLPQWRDQPPPNCIAAGRDQLLYLSPKRAQRLMTPPQMNNHGNFVVSLGALCGWLAPQAEALGVELYPGFPASELLFDDDGAVCGVATGDMGVDREGAEKATYTPGVEIRAPLTVFAEGCRGHLSKQLIKKYQLDEQCDPQTYGVGIKELWQLPTGRTEPGLIQHSIGWPLDPKTYGGAFVYHLEGDRVAMGFVCGLDYEDPEFSPFEAFQQFKHHPRFHALLEGGSIVSSGARALSEGGWQSLPRMEMPGALLIGDAAGTLNVPKVKGIHNAMHGAMIAAEHLMEQPDGKGFDARLRESAVGRELYKVRNIRPGFHKGLWRGLINAGWETVTAGKSPWTLHNRADHAALTAQDQHQSPRRAWVNRDLAPKDRLAWVYSAATEHDEDQPIHLQVADPELCVDRCAKEFNNPCTRFCPANVYEMIGEDNQRQLQINAANCVHCKTCDIKDPYQNITWVTPEGGSGPNYQNM